MTPSATSTTLLRGALASGAEPFRSGRSAGAAGTGPVVAGAPPAAAAHQGAGSVAPDGPGAEGLTPQDPRLTALEAEVAALQARIDRMRRDHADALRDEAERARAKALATVERDSRAMIAALEEGLARAQSALVTHLGQLEREAVRVAEAALEPVFGPGADLAGLVMPMIRHQLGALQERSVVELRYSPRDAVDPAGVAAALALAGQAGAVAVADPALAAGSIRIAMRLGHVRLDLADHAGAVRALLAELTRDPGRRNGEAAP